MHEYSKRIGEHIKSCYSDFNKMNREELDELKAWACVMKDLTEYDINKRGIEAMDEAEQEEKMYGRMGYRGRAANGRFVHRPGRGRSAGYTPYLHMMDDGMDDYDMYDEMPYPMTGYRMGYTDGNRGGNMGNSSSSGSYSGNYGGGNSRSGYESMRQPSRYGESYDRYKDSRRHYTENPTPEHQQKMKENADDVFDDIEELAKKMYSEADANDKAKFKQKMTQLVQNMK